VSAVTGTETPPADLLQAARGGDSRAFQVLVAPHLRVLHLHSYRMLGSYGEAEDAVQETLLRAWQGLAGFEGRAPLLHWLYRITTTTCLKVIRDRRREPATTADVAWLQPYPDTLLDQIATADADPAGIAERRESVAGAGLGRVGIHQLEDVRRAEPLLDNRLHQVTSHRRALSW
jgi:RNA polymerase sigma-70 factor, ECF subfamily